jgi:hypothetical protein
LPLASLPSGLPRNPNVLLIRTHPNPSPSVANRNDTCGSPSYIFSMVHSLSSIGQELLNVFVLLIVLCY